jgi:hypothetical protein
MGRSIARRMFDLSPWRWGSHRTTIIGGGRCGVPTRRNQAASLTRRYVLGAHGACAGSKVAERIVSLPTQELRAGGQERGQKPVCDDHHATSTHVKARPVPTDGPRRSVQETEAIESRLVCTNAFETRWVPGDAVSLWSEKMRNPYLTCELFQVAHLRGQLVFANRLSA